MNDDCIFCKIAAGEIPSTTLYEDLEFRMILDVGPATRGHALVLTKKHVEDIFELPEEIVGRAFLLGKMMAGVMKEKLKCDGLNLVQNNGEVAGQTVKHFHIHVIPRYKDDGQHIGWVPGEISQEELETVRREIIL